MTRPATIIKRLLSTDSSSAIGAALELVPPPSLDTCCCRPTCGKRFAWSGQGRPPRFCSKECRFQFPRERARLQDDLGAYQRLAAECPASWDQSVQLTSRIAALKMQLLRYRPF